MFRSSTLILASLAVVVLAGCAGIAHSFQALPTTNTFGRVSISPNVKLAGTRFSATDVHLKKVACTFNGSYHATDIDFTARGTATGSHPGTFTAEGAWQEAKNVFDFSERFKIKSRTTIVGYIESAFSFDPKTFSCRAFESTNHYGLEWFVKNPYSAGSARAIIKKRLLKEEIPKVGQELPSVPNERQSGARFSLEKSCKHFHRTAQRAVAEAASRELATSFVARFLYSA